MNRQMQYGISGVLLVVLVVAVLLRWHYLWLFVLLVEFGVLAICVFALIENLPPRIQSRLNTNCKRIDGSWSAGREQVEKLAIRRLSLDLFSVFVATAMFWNLAYLMLFGIPVISEFNFAELSSRAWLFLYLIIVLSVFATSMAIKTGYLHALKMFSAGIEHRSQQYKIRDMQAVVDGKIIS